MCSSGANSRSETLSRFIKADLAEDLSLAMHLYDLERGPECERSAKTVCLTYVTALRPLHPT